MRIPYKTCRNEDLRAPFSEVSLKIIKNHYLENVFAMRFQNLGKPYKTNGNTVSQKPKTRCDNPYKPVEFQDFWDLFWEVAPKMIQKALPREGFRNAFSKRRKPL